MLHGFLVELSKAILGIGVPLAYYYGHSAIRDHYSAKRFAREQAALLAEASQGLRTRIHLGKPNGEAHSHRHDEDFDGDKDHDPTDNHPVRRGVRGRKSSTE